MPTDVPAFSDRHSGKSENPGLPRFWLLPLDPRFRGDDVLVAADESPPSGFGISPPHEQDLCHETP